VEVQPAETTLYSLSEVPPRPSEDRREDGRLMTLYRVGSLSIGERRELCLIKNISAGGMMVRCYCPIPEGTRISVELKCGQPLSGSVSWTRDIHIGIAFDEPIDVIDILSTSSEGPRPRMPRIEVAGFATIREGASTYRMRVCDISQGGLKVQCENCLPVGADVVVTLSGSEPQHGVVRWTSDNQMGIIFNRLLALPMLVEWLQGERVAQRTAD
jgi:hypothetical protein